MKYISFLFISSMLGLSAFSQLDYFGLQDLNTLCKKEDFEAVKTFLKIKGYEIYTDNENYDHGSYFVLAEIQAKLKLGELNNDNLKGSDLDNIYDKIDISYHENEVEKDLDIEQNLDGANLLEYIPESRKFDPVFHWFSEDWDYVKVNDSVWSKGERNKVNNESWGNYFYSKKFQDRSEFFIDFKKEDSESSETKDYSSYYVYEEKLEPDFNSKGTPHKHIFTSSDIVLNTTFPKSKNVISNKNILSFPLIKSGSSYLIKIKFGKIIKIYLLDSGASDMTLDQETYQYLKDNNQLKIQNNLTDREYILANGSKVEYKRVQIPTLSINNIVVNKIDAILVENGKPLLLGKSFLDSFKSWKVDNKNNVLIVELF